MVEDAFTNIQSKIKINVLLSDPFNLTRGVWRGCLFSVLLYINEGEVLYGFINVNKRINGIQTGDNEIINWNRKFCWHHHHLLKRYYLPKVILKLYDDVTSSKINFSKSLALWAGAYKNKISQPGKMKYWKFPLKYLELTL